MPALIFHITQDSPRNHMCTQPFVFMSSEMCSAIIRGWTEVVRGGVMTGGEEERGRGGGRWEEWMGGRRQGRRGRIRSEARQRVGSRRKGGREEGNTRWDVKRCIAERIHIHMRGETRQEEERMEEIWKLRKVKRSAEQIKGKQRKSKGKDNNGGEESGCRERPLWLK